MKQVLKIEKLNYKGLETRIKIVGSISPSIKDQLKQIEGFSYSKTYSCWHLPYSKEVYRQLKQHFEIQTTVEPPQKAKPVMPDMLDIKTAKPLLNKARIYLDIDKRAKKIYVRHPYNTYIFQQFGQIPNSWWQKEKHQWIIAGTNDNYLLIKQLAEHLQMSIEVKEVLPAYQTDQNPTIKQFVESLQMKNYSHNTLEAYYPYFKDFVDAHSEIDLKTLGYDPIYRYIKKTVAEKKLSDTGIRHLVSAIKFYYEKMLGRDQMMFYLEKKIDVVIDPRIIDLETFLSISERINHPTSLLLV